MAMAVVAQRQQTPSKLQWGELEDEDDYNFLPSQVVVGPNENDVKKVIKYRLGDDGEKVRVTTTTLIRKLAHSRLNRCAVKCHSWAVFGDAVGSSLTMISTEEILLE